MKGPKCLDSSNNFQFSGIIHYLLGEAGAIKTARIANYKITGVETKNFTGGRSLEVIMSSTLLVLPLGSWTYGF